MTRKASFAPIVDQKTKLLLLGSLPGEASLRAERYYAHPQNQFWRLIAGVLDRGDLPQLAYADRLDALLAEGVGLWDVVADAVRLGSLDGAIRDARHNDLRRLIERLPALRVIGFNGGTAARIGRKLIGAADGIVLVDLPSSSPAYTLALAEKQRRWGLLATFLGGHP